MDAEIAQISRAQLAPLQLGSAEVGAKPWDIGCAGVVAARDDRLIKVG
jgi:hypothetical protein